MDPAHVVLLLGVFIAVAAIAFYLIWISLILKHVVNRLVTILGAVQATTDAAQPVGPIIDDINRDLADGRRVLEDCVARLQDSRGEPVGATAASNRHGGGLAAETGPHATPDSLAGAGGVGEGTAVASRPPAPEGDSGDRLAPGTEDDRPDPRTEEDRPAPYPEEDRPDPYSAEPDPPARPPQGRGRGWWNR